MSARRTRAVCPPLVAALAVAAAVAAEPAAPPPELRVGDEGVALTVLSGNEIREIPLRFLGTFDSFGGPGFDLHLVELEGPDVEQVGVANGMSGSPVYVGGRLIGALSYRLGAMPKTPVAGVTPLAVLRDAERRGTAPAAAASSGFEPIATPVLAAALPEAVRAWLAGELEPLGFVLAPGGGKASGAPDSGELRPGSPVGVELVRGDMRMAATGTVTLVEGDRVFAFGHPFLGTGRVEMPMVSAEVVHTLADLAGSMRLSNVGGELGAIVEDRLGAVVGRIGAHARMVPIDVTVRGGDYGDQTYHYEMIRHPRLAPVLAGAVVSTSLRTSGYSDEVTLLARGRVRLEGAPDLPLEMAYSSGAGPDPSMAVATELLLTLSSLGFNPFDELRLEGLELEIDANPEPISYRVQDVQYDRGGLAPGQPLHVRCVLQRYRGGTEIRDLEIPLPDDLSGRRGLVLLVGNPSAVDRALGDPVSKRLRSAVDLASVVRALDDRRADNRLTAVVYRSGSAFVARGEAWVELPPSAERLLATQGGAQARPGAIAAALSRTEVELDGPVLGGARLTLRVDREEAEGDEE